MTPRKQQIFVPDASVRASPFVGSAACSRRSRYMSQRKTLNFQSTHTIALALLVLWLILCSLAYSVLLNLLWPQIEALPKQDPSTSAQKSYYESKKSDGISNRLVLERNTKKCQIVSRSTLYSPTCNNRGQGTPRRLLITGVGRSGTNFLTDILRKAGMRVSHDDKRIKLENAPDGAVSWPHAFNEKKCDYPHFVWRRRRRRRLSPKHNERFFLHIIQVVRDPLKTIQSRWDLGNVRFVKLASCNTAVFPKQTVQPHRREHFDHEKYTLLQTLQHWVLWNSFLESFAEWRFRVEDLNGTTIHEIYRLAALDPLEHENISTAAAAIQVKPLGPIKAAKELDSILASSTGKKNSARTRKQPQSLTWEKLMNLDRNYTLMAQMMAQRYGYTVSITDSVRNLEQVCGFGNKTGLWDCRLRHRQEVDVDPRLFA